MGLLRADLQALGNSLRGDGRSGLLGRLAPPLILGGMHWMLGSVLLAPENRELWRLLHQRGDTMTQLYAHALAPGPVVAGWIGFAQAQRQLFEAQELPLWLAAPMWRGRAALQILLRACSTALVWAAALTAPLLVQLLGATNASPAGYAAMPFAIATVTLPPLCLVVALQIALLRVAGGRFTRHFGSITSALAAFGFPIFLLAQVFASGQGGTERLAAAARRGDAGNSLTNWASEALHHLALGHSPNLPGAILLLPPLLGLLLVFVVAPLHPRAVQNHQLAARNRSGRRARWPASPIAVLRRKEVAQLLQQPGAILHMVLVGALVHLFAAQGTLVHGMFDDPTVPAAMQQCTAMLTLWFLAVLMLLYSHMGRLAAWEGGQWPLFVQAPIAPSWLLASKLQVIALLLMWPIVVAAWAGWQWFDAGLPALLPFAGFAAAGTMMALAVVAMIGTWPWLCRRETDGRLTQGSRGLVGSIALVFGFYCALSPAFFAWIWLLQQHRLEARTGDVDAARWGAPLLLAALGIAGLALSIALAVAGRNYRRLLAPR